jgi:signal transduction histidine kinase
MRGRLWAIPVALLLLLAAIHLRWVERLRAAEILETRLAARQRAEALAQEFDGEIGRAYDRFNVELSTMHGSEWNDFLVRYDTWLAKAPQPNLFRAWYVVHDDGGDGIVLKQFDPLKRTFPEVAWSDELLPIRAWLQTRGPCRRLAAELANPPGVAIRLFAPDRAVHSGYGPVRGYAIGLLDRETLEERFLPSLAHKYFGDISGLEYEIEIVDTASSAPIFSTSGSPRPRPDVEVPLFRVAFAHLNDLFLDCDRLEPREGAWLLRATHRDGSIEAHVARSRSGDRILGAGVVGLLAVTLVLAIGAAYRARRLSEQQAAFIVGVSHELKVPLIAVQSAAESLATGRVVEPDRIRAHGTLVAGEGRRLSKLVEQAIDFAALETGARPAVEESYALAPLLEEVVAEARSPVVLEIGAALPALRGDPKATRQVVLHLLENAWKHAPDARVTIRVEPAQWRRRSAVRIDVIDDGEGIAPADLAHVFEPFYRGARARLEKVPGSGLGLSIVARLVEQQNGAIAVRSSAGSGTTFTVRLPAA